MSEDESTIAAAGEFADKLLAGITHDYEINYTDAAGDYFVCTITPGESAEEMTIDGWPDDEQLQAAIAKQFQRQVGADPMDHWMVLSAGERLHVAKLEHKTLAERESPAFPVTLADHIEEWQREDEEEEAQDDEQERQRQALVNLRQLSNSSAALCRAGYPQLAAQLNAMLRTPFDQIDADAANALAMQVHSVLMTEF